MTTTRKIWTDHIQTIPGPDADAAAIARGLHDIANAIRETKPKKLETVVNITDQDVELGEEMGREVARALHTPGLAGAIDTAAETKIYHAPSIIAESAWFGPVGSAAPAPGVTPEEAGFTKLGWIDADALSPVKTEEQLLEELEALPEKVEVVLDPPRMNYHTDFGEEEGLVSRVYVDSPGRFRLEMVSEEHDFHWHTRAGAVRQLGLTAADFSLPEADLDPWVKRVREVSALVNALSEKEDVVNTPSHYRQEDGLECIEITAGFDFIWGSATKYVYRCLSKGKPVEDLRKALRYIEMAKERGVEKPSNSEAYETYADIYQSTAYGTPEEQRAYVMMTLLDECETAENVTTEIEEMIEMIEEGQK